MTMEFKVKKENPRTTIFLTDVLDHNLTLLARETGKTKNQLMQEGVRRILRDNGYENPDVKAILTIDKSRREE